jgi:hypothetical protein
LVETRKGILSRAKLALRPITILASLTRRQGSSINVPLRGAALDPAPARSARGLSGVVWVCLESYEKVLDNADDVIHGTWARAPAQLTLKLQFWRVPRGLANRKPFSRSAIYSADGIAVGILPGSSRGSGLFGCCKSGIKSLEAPPGKRLMFGYLMML